MTAQGSYGCQKLAGNFASLLETWPAFWKLGQLAGNLASSEP